MEFQITNVTPEGIEGVCANIAAAKMELGSAVGAPVEFAYKSVGQVVRTYHDPCGAQVIKLAVSDRETLHMAESGCLSCIRILPGSVELTDRLTDHGQTFQITKSTGEKLCKRFVGPSEHELLAKHADKVYPGRELTKNEKLSLLLAHTEFEKRDHRKSGKDSRGANWPNGAQSIGTAREQILNRNSRV